MVAPALSAPRALRTGRRGATFAAVLLLCGAAAAEPLERFRPADEPQVSERVILHEEWASELVFALGLAGALPEDHAPRDLFGLLCAERAERSTDAEGRRVTSGAPFQVAVDAPRGREPTDPVRAVVTLPGTALYALTVDGVGPQRWAVDQRPIGHLDPSALGVGQAPRVVPLARGPHELSGYLTHRSRVDRIELMAYRPLCIAPKDGWRTDRGLTFAALARTLVQAMGLERRLPIARPPLSLEGERFRAASARGGRTNRALADPASGDTWATAVSSPAEFTYRARVAQPGVFTLLARIQGGGDQMWSIDGRYRVSVRGAGQGASFRWAHVVTLRLGAGDHAVRALVPRGAGIDSLHLIPRSAFDIDYVALLEEEDFEVGVPQQPVTQTAAYANLAHPLFAERAARFLPRLAGHRAEAPGWIRRAEVESVVASRSEAGR